MRTPLWWRILAGLSARVVTRIRSTWWATCTTGCSKTARASRTSRTGGAAWTSWSARTARPTRCTDCTRNAWVTRLLTTRKTGLITCWRRVSRSWWIGLAWWGCVGSASRRASVRRLPLKATRWAIRARRCSGGSAWRSVRSPGSTRWTVARWIIARSSRRSGRNFWRARRLKQAKKT